MASSMLLSAGKDFVLASSNSSKPLQYLIEVIGLDHGYSKPWSSQQRVPNPRPVKTLFTRDAEADQESLAAKGSDGNKAKPEEMLIDVEAVDEVTPSGPYDIKMQYDVGKSKIAMGECERYVSSVSSKRTPDTWEELICRTSWTNQQNVLFDKVLKIVSSYRLARLTYEGSANEPVLCKVALDKATKRVRQILSRVEWDPKLTTWLHASMVDGLSIPLLACYLDILQTLRSKVPSLVDQMIASPTSHRRVSPGATDNMTSLLKRPWDSTIGLSSFQRQRKVSGPPLLLIVPSGPTTNSSANAAKRSRFWHHHMSNLGKVIPVTMHLSNSGRGVSIGQCLDHMIGAVQAKVLELKNHFPNRPVVLIGWSTGALVSFQVSLVEPVCAVVCLGFPLLGLEGIRGESHDPFLENKTPTMFVFGSLSNCCSLPDIEEFRKKLIAETSLLVIGGADDQLRLTCSKKKIEGVTQSIVDRRIMDEIGDFLSNAVSTMNNVQNRSDYFDFDEVDNRRKKPKTEKRKRSATGGANPAGESAKKPRSKVTKPATPKTPGSATKKPKSVKNVKRPTVGQPTLIPGPPTARPTGLPISTLPGTPASITAGIIRGVNVPVTGVNVPVSAVIKQGSLGGRSFVFSCPQPTGTISGATNPVTQPTVMITSGDAGNTQHLKVVMSSAPGMISSPGAMMTSSARQPIVQYKASVVTSPLLARSSSSVATSASAVRTVASANVATAAAKAFGRSVQTLVTSPAMTSPAMTSSAMTSSSMTTTRISHNHQTASLPLVTKRVVGSLGAASTPNSRSAVVPSSNQAQFIMHKGQLSAVNKMGTTRVLSASTTNSQAKSTPGSLVQRGATPVQTKPQLILTTSSDSSTKVPRVNPLPVSSQTVTPLVRRTPSPQAVTRTIQVGVTDPKKPLLTKRTVTYSPSTKGINVVSRSGPSSSMVGMVARAAATAGTPVSNMQASFLTARAYRPGAQIQNVQDLSKQAAHKQPTSAQIKFAQQAVATLALSGAQSNNAQRSGAQLAGALVASGSAPKPSAQKPSAQIMSALTKNALKSLVSTSTSQGSGSMPLYHNSEDEKLVEKIRGIVNDVVGCTPRYLKTQSKQVASVASTSHLAAAAVTTVAKAAEAPKKT